MHPKIPGDTRWTSKWPKTAVTEIGHVTGYAAYPVTWPISVTAVLDHFDIICIQTSKWPDDFFPFVLKFVLQMAQKKRGKLLGNFEV